MTNKEYQFYNLDDLLQLDEGQIVRFCEELPGIILYTQKIIEALKDIGNPIPEGTHIFYPLHWCDDGKKDFTVSGNKIEINIVDEKT